MSAVKVADFAQTDLLDFFIVQVWYWVKHQTCTRMVFFPFFRRKKRLSPYSTQGDIWQVKLAKHKLKKKEGTALNECKIKRKADIFFSEKIVKWVSISNRSSKLVGFTQ